tara:strand:+ start:8860 stop:10923 length:2064 start_codon:yes stop_codon:yes gene_type:complete
MIALPKFRSQLAPVKQNRGAINRTAGAKFKLSTMGDTETLWGWVRKSKAIANSLADQSDQALQRHTRLLRSHAARPGQTVDDDLLCLAAGGVIEAIKRTLNVTLFDVQLFAGMLVANGAVAEMQTGEGKTLSGVLPAYVHALFGRGVHVATTNEYLAHRDYHRLAPVFDRLAITTGIVTESATEPQARAAYDADITFGPGHVFGFDFLRDQLVLSRDESSPLGSQIYRKVNAVANRGRMPGCETYVPDCETYVPDRETRGRGLYAAIVDEIDNVLIDDATSPLLLSQADADEAADAAIHHAAVTTAAALDDNHYTIDRSKGEVGFSDSGYCRIYADPVMATHSKLVRPWHEYVGLAIRAVHCLRQDVDYVVRDEQVQIVDSSTGRVFADRTWSSGLHQAVSAKHGLLVTPESKTLARITRQRFYRHYQVLAGMTGTAAGCESEFARIYGMPVVRVPLRLQSRRLLLPDHFCQSETDKWDAIVDETKRMHEAGRAVLIGTHSIQQSRSVASRLQRAGLEFQLLNGVQDADEASVIATAGTTGGITVATNLAGRGTDIQLDRSVAQAGGLHVIVAQRHSLTRVDRQLMGRCARCGDPGSARVYVSADEPLLVQDAPWIGRAICRHVASGNDSESTGALIAGKILKLQTSLARKSEYARRRMLQFDHETESLLQRDTKKDESPQGCLQLA